MDLTKVQTVNEIKALGFDQHEQIKQFEALLAQAQMNLQAVRHELQVRARIPKEKSETTKDEQQQAVVDDIELAAKKSDVPEAIKDRLDNGQIQEERETP